MKRIQGSLEKLVKFCMRRDLNEPWNNKRRYLESLVAMVFWAELLITYVLKHSTSHLKRFSRFYYLSRYPESQRRDPAFATITGKTVQHWKRNPSTVWMDSWDSGNENCI